MSKSKVIILKSSRVSGNPSSSDLKHLEELLGEGVKALAGESDSGAAMVKLIPAGKRVAIKPNCLAGREMSSSPVLCSAIIEILKAGGNNPDNIVVWERSERELKWGGYQLNPGNSGPKVVGIDSPGIGYSREFSSFGTAGSLVTTVLTEMVDYQINFPVLKDHSIAGLSGGMKNLYGAVHNPNKYHDNNCDPYAADVYCLPEIKQKNRLTITDCFKIQYNAGPGYNARYAVDSNMVLISDDPVSIDVVALEIIDDLRRKNGLMDLRSAGRFPGYLKTAADEKHKLGNFDKDFIEKIEITV